MSVLSDKWIKKISLEKEMIKPFVSKQASKKEKYHLAYPLMVMMRECLKNLRYLLM